MFKNIFVFAFTRKFNDENLEIKLESNLFRECGDNELYTPHAKYLIEYLQTRVKRAN